jgi:hypothetical protein
MRVACLHCRRGLDYATERPSFCPFCGQPLPPATDEKTTPADPALTAPAAGPVATAFEAPQRVGPYRLVRRIGAGGMGAVYEAEEDGGGRRVALKLIAPEYSGSRVAVDRFRREGQLAGLITHPRCVFVLAADEDAGRPYLVMELMPGDTLQDLVKRRGPLPLREAVARVLDVIDGLHEVHRHGIVHRDVKPSNCFLGHDGRVKVGDFGLARSREAEAHLTRTGSFVGTPLFAAPEQLKGEAVDERGDVYAVAATLYYLLSGRAPHEARDAAALAARIASEPAPPLRSLRPGLPRALERVVLRGLERQRDRRYQDLEALRGALLPFAPAAPLSVSGIGRRVVAVLIDIPIAVVLFILLSLATAAVLTREFIHRHDFNLDNIGVAAVVLLYFGSLEAVWGCSLGKRLLGLRVYRSTRDRPAGMVRACARAAAFGLLLLLPLYLVGLLHFLPLDCGTLIVLSLLTWTQVPGMFVIICTMRARNGYRGLHEFLSGTRTVQLPLPERRPRRNPHFSPRDVPRLTRRLARQESLPTAVGPFRVRGALGREPAAFLLGEDSFLERDVLLRVQPAPAEAPAPARRELARATRLRWLTGGTEGALRWDAFVAPTGRSVTEVIAATGALSWAEVKPLLAQLTDELAAAHADGTLPEMLTLDQVLIRSDGAVELLDAPATETVTASAAVADDRALTLLRDFTVLTLEGRVRPADDIEESIHRPLPLHAAAVLARLFGPSRGAAAVEAFRERLAAIAGRSARVSLPLRAFHLLVQGVLLFVLFFVGIILDNLTRKIGPRWIAEPASWFPIATSIGVACLLRGGPSFSMAGVALVRSDGRPAARWQAAVRSALVWGQMLIPLLVTTLLRGQGRTDLADSQLAFAAFALVMFPVVWLPRRTLHDRLAGTHLVPE